MYRIVARSLAAFSLLCAGVALEYAQPAKPARKAHVLVISVDGMRPDYVTEAARHGLQIPTLRRFLVEGTYATGVNGVVPTITYPSHTTMITGVWPVEHGIYGNQKFLPFAEGKEQITEVSDIRVPTLWEAAHNAGYVVSSVGWPVTTGAKFIDYLLPANAAFEGGDPDGASTKPDPNKQYDNPRGLREQLADAVAAGKDAGVNNRRYLWQLAVIKRFKPEFMTLHVGALDHEEHVHGPFSPEANASLEREDKHIAEIIAAEKAVYPDAYIFVVSDHGFLPTDHAVRLNAILQQNGLIDPKTQMWTAAAYDTGGTAAIMLREPDNAADVARVTAVVNKIAQDPQYGIGRVYTHNELVARGGRADALFMLDPALGWRFAAGFGKEVVDVPGTGAHGQMPEHPELRSTFMVIGPGVTAARNLGIIDMRQIAPTLAKVLGVSLPTAKQPAIQLVNAASATPGNRK